MRRLLALMPALLWACPHVPATNPYDPEAPAEQQQKASVHGIAYGDLLDDEDPEPLRGATVELSGPTTPESSPFETDTDGAFRFNDLIPGTYSLEVSHPAFFRQGRDLLLEPGDERELETILVLLPQTGEGEVGHVTGVVLLEAQTGLAVEDHSGVVIEVQDTGIRTVSNAAGAYDIFIAEGSYSLDFSAPDHIPQTSAQVEVGEGATTTVPSVTLLANPGYVTGTVVLRDAEGNDEADHSGVSIGVPGTAITAVDSGVDGAFTLEAPAGTYTLVARIDAYDDQPIPGVVVHGGITTILPDPIIMPYSRGNIVGHAELGGGAGDHSGIAVSLDDVGLAATTNTAGDYTIFDVPVGVHPLTASRDGYFPATVGAVTVDADVDNPVQDLTLAKKEGNFQIRSLSALSSAGATYDPEVELVLTPPPGTLQIRITGDLDASESTDWRDYPLVPDTHVLLNAASQGTRTLSVTFTDGTTDSGPFSASIVLDTLPPDLDMLPAQDLEVIIDGGAEWSNDDTASAPQVTLTFVADDLGTGIRQMQLSETNSFTDTAPVPVTFVPVKTFSFASDPPDAQVNTVYARFIDHAGNWSSVVSSEIKLDREDPVVDLITIDCNGTDDSPYCNTQLVELTIAASDADPGTGVSGVALMVLSNAGGFPVTVWEPYATDRVWPLSSGLNPRNVFVKVQDYAGNVSTIASDADGVNLDVEPPAGVTVTITGRDAQGASTVLTRLDDTSGLPEVRLDLTATDANFSATPLLISNDNDFTSASSYAVGPVDPWELGSAADGTHVVYVRAVDLAGNVADSSASIVLDTTPPAFRVSPGGVTILGRNVDGTPSAGGSTARLDVEIALDVTGAPADVFISTSDPSTCAGQTYDTPFAPVLPVTLTAAGTVWVCLRDAAGNVSTAPEPATITVDQTAPSCQVTLSGFNADGSVATSGTALTTIDATSDCGAIDPDEMAIVASSQYLACATATYGSFSTVTQVQISPTGPAAKDIKACYRDALGNYTTTPINADATILYDATPPTDPSASFQNGAWATGVSVVLDLAATGDTEMRITGDIVGGTTGWETSADTRGVELTSTDGPHVVAVTFRDELLNESSAVYATTSLDEGDPTLTSVVVVGRNEDGTPNASASADTRIDVIISATDSSWLHIETGASPPDCSEGTGVPFSSYTVPFSPRLEVDTVTGNVHVCVADQAGNVAGPLSGSITIDTTPPENCAITLSGYNADGTVAASGTATTTVRVTTGGVGCGDADTSIVGIALAESAAGMDCTTAAYQPFASPVSFIVSPGDNPPTKTIRACYVDEVGNVTATSTAATIDLDQTPPESGTITVVRATTPLTPITEPASSTPSPDVELFLNAVGATFMRFGTTPDLSALSWDPYDTARQTLSLPVVADPEGPPTCNTPEGEPRTVYAQFRDDLLNVSPVVIYTLTLDECDPGQPTVALVPQPGADTGFVRSFDFAVEIGDTGTASGLWIEVVGDTDPCSSPPPDPPAADFVPVAPSVIATVAADGAYKVCVTPEDDAGNQGTAQSTTVTVDTTPPDAPVMSPNNVANVNRACARIEPTASTDENFWYWESRNNGEPWTPFTDAGARIEFTLAQDTDNLLEIRAVDRAGNAGSSNAAFLGEVSSYFVPTPHTMKSVCGHGSYVILKDMSVTRPFGIRINGACPAGTTGQTRELPAIWLFDLTTRTLDRLDGGDGLAQILADSPDGGDGAYPGLAQVVDAACGREDDQLLVTYRESDRSRMYIFEDPTIDPTQGLVMVDGGAPLGVGISHVDMVDWLTYPAARLIAVNWACEDPDGPFGPDPAVEFYEISRPTLDGAPSFSSQAPWDETAKKAGGDANQYVLRGLAENNGDRFYLEGSTLKQYYTSNGCFSPTTGIRTIATGLSWGSRLKAASYYHASVAPDAAKSQTVYLSDTGDAIHVRADACGSGTVLGTTTATDPLTGELAPFADIGSGTIAWVDEERQGRGFRIGADYDNPDEIQGYRFPVDQNAPIWPARWYDTDAQPVPGEPLVLFHSRALGQPGIVVGYSDELGCYEDRGPFWGTAAQIPGQILAADYNYGGRGISYADDTTGNTGGDYRTDDVDINCLAVCPFVGWISDGEWLEYDIDVATSRAYSLVVRVGSPNTTGRFHIEIDGVDVTGTLAVPDTGAFSTYQEVTYGSYGLTAGPHVLRLVNEVGAHDLHWLQLN